MSEVERIYMAKLRKYENPDERMQALLYAEAKAEAEFAAYTVSEVMRLADTGD